MPEILPEIVIADTSCLIALEIVAEALKIAGE